MALARKTSPERFISELQALVTAKYPNAMFRVTGIPDADDGTAIWAYVDAIDEDVRELVSDRELEILVDHDIDIVTLPMPLEAWEN